MMTYSRAPSGNRLVPGDRRKARKGMILAGGSGTRLYSMTMAASKQFMPLYGKRMIYYPLTTPMQAGICEICILSTEQDLPLLAIAGRWRVMGLSLHYACRRRRKGLPRLI